MENVFWIFITLKLETECFVGYESFSEMSTIVIVLQVLPANTLCTWFEELSANATLFVSDYLSSDVLKGLYFEANLSILSKLLHYKWKLTIAQCSS